MKLTKHAKKRQQQRGIGDLTLQYLYRFGAIQYDGHGGIKFFFDKKSKQDIRHTDICLSNKELHSYLVMSSDSEQVITVGHLYKKIHRR